MIRSLLIPAVGWTPVIAWLAAGYRAQRPSEEQRHIDRLARADRRLERSRR